MNQDRKIEPTEYVYVLGVPSSSGTNADTAPVIDSHNGPAALRESFIHLMQGYDLFNPVSDLGDLDCGDSVPELLSALQGRVEKLLDAEQRFILLGGAHTLTLGSLRALHSRQKQFSLIYVDAHPDILPEDRIHYGSTLYHAIEEGALDPKRIVYLGIRQIERDEQRLIDHYGILSFSGLDIFTLGTTEVLKRIHEHCSGPWYLSVDLDSLDLSYAPGITTPAPFGLSPREVLALVSPFCGANTLGAEIVELAPVNDEKRRTARLAASLLFQMAVGMVNK